MPEQVYAHKTRACGLCFAYLSPGGHADFREDTDGQNNHAGGGDVGLDRHGEEQDPGQGGHSDGAAAADLQREAAGGRAIAGGLQRAEGVDPHLVLRLRGGFGELL